MYPQLPKQVSLAIISTTSSPAETGTLIPMFKHPLPQTDPHAEGCSLSEGGRTQQEPLNPNTAGDGAALPQSPLLLVHLPCLFLFCLWSQSDDESTFIPTVAVFGEIKAACESIGKSYGTFQCPLFGTIAHPTQTMLQTSPGNRWIHTAIAQRCPRYLPHSCFS